jgi:hypothetical protein
MAATIPPAFHNTKQHITTAMIVMKLNAEQKKHTKTTEQRQSKSK